MFSFFPTTLIWVPQLHKDLYSNFGWFCFFWTIALIYKKESPLKIFTLSSLCVLSILSVRPMYLNLILVLFSFSIFLSLIFDRKKIQINRIITFNSLGFVPILIGITFFYHFGLKNAEDESILITKLKSNSSAITECSIFTWQKSSILPSFIDSKLETLAFLRKRQICFMPSGTNSNSQVNFFPNNSIDLIKNLPGTLLTAAFEITPVRSFKIKNTQSLVIVPEMIIYYFFLAYFIYALLNFKSGQHSIFLFISLFGVMIFSITTPNLGTLHRTRFPFFILILSIGSCYFFNKFYNLSTNKCQTQCD